MIEAMSGERIVSKYLRGWCEDGPAEPAKVIEGAALLAGVRLLRLHASSGSDCLQFAICLGDNAPAVLEMTGQAYGGTVRVSVRAEADLAGRAEEMLDLITAKAEEWRPTGGPVALVAAADDLPF
jgi:hypothetical protein